MNTERILKLKRLVIKVGSSTVTGRGGVVNCEFLKPFCEAVAAFRAKGVGVVVVSSGAIALGRPLLGCSPADRDLPTKQACAAAGQPALMQSWICELEKAGLKAAQILITRDDFKDRRRYLNARETIHRLLELGAIPIVNENDTVAVDEIQFGDNDNLASFVAGLVDSDLLVLLTDVEGVFDADPRKNKSARALTRIDEITDGMLQAAGEAGALGRGGMRSKLLAARTAQQFGIPTVIAKGEAQTLEKLSRGHRTGTWVEPAEGRMKSRKRWIAHALIPAGEIRVDAGAEQAIRRHGKSLLPGGIAGIRGSFERGDLVEITTLDGRLLGRGLACYPAMEVLRLCGHRSDEIRQILGYSVGDEVVHRDDMVIQCKGGPDA